MAKMSAPRARSPRVAIVTCAAQALLYAEEQEIPARLRARGVEAEAVRWDDATIDWTHFDAAVIRSTWDYFTRYEEFCAWLDRIERATRLYNSPSLVRWNADKLYLGDLEKKGVRIVPTVFCQKGEPADLAAILRASEWENAVMKPSVSGGAYRTHRVRAAEAATHQAEMTALLATSGVLVQPFVPEIQTEGEWSFLFFDGVLSHTVLKRPGSGDYRVQPEFGASFAAATPDPWLIAQAQSILTALPETPAYARIDCVRRERALYLMEAELIEPYLYMSAAPKAMDAFVGVLERLARAS
jgi:hypothetical protein